MRKSANAVRQRTGSAAGAQSARRQSAWPSPAVSRQKDDADQDDDGKSRSFGRPPPSASPWPAIPPPGPAWPAPAPARPAHARSGASGRAARAWTSPPANNAKSRRWRRSRPRWRPANRPRPTTAWRLPRSPIPAPAPAGAADSAAIPHAAASRTSRPESTPCVRPGAPATARGAPSTPAPTPASLPRPASAPVLLAHQARCWCGPAAALRRQSGAS